MSENGVRAKVSATEVFRAAVQLCQTYSFLREQIGYLDDDDPAWAGYTPFEIRIARDLTPEEVRSVIKKFEREFEELGRLYDSVSDWWLAERPLAHAPHVTSYLELVLRQTARMAGCIEYKRSGSLTVLFALIKQFTYPLSPDGENLWAALRCEATTMSFRPPSGPPLLEVIEELTFDRTATFSNIRQAALPELILFMFTDWRALSDSEQLELIQESSEGRQPRGQGAKGPPEPLELIQEGNEGGDSRDEEPDATRARGRPPNSREVKDIVCSLRRAYPNITWAELTAKVNSELPYEEPRRTDAVRKIWTAEMKKRQALGSEPPRPVRPE